jgi:hypothetical protein
MYTPVGTNDEVSLEASSVLGFDGTTFRVD